MKTKIIILIFSLLIFFLVTTNGQMVNAGELSSTSLFDVDEVFKNPASFNGKIRIRGVVAAIIADQSIFTLIDLKEFKSCKVVSCALNQIPIRYKDKPPVPKDKVIVYGSIKKNENRYLFILENIEKIN